MKKRFPIVLLALALVLSLVPCLSIPASAAEGGSEVIEWNQETTAESECFTLTAAEVDDMGWYVEEGGSNILLAPKNKCCMITAIDACIGWNGLNYAYVDYSSGEKEETGPVENYTTVHVKNIDAGRLKIICFSSAVAFKGITVYYEHTPRPTDYEDNGDGTHSFKCADCGKSVTESHDYLREFVAERYLKSEATCEEPGVFYKSCNCGAASDTETFTVGRPRGHSWIAPVSCTEPGYCERCHAEGETIPHVLSEATCERASLCMNCHQFIGDPLPHLQAAAGCTNSSICLRCHQVLGPALGHDPSGDWEQHDEQQHKSACLRCPELVYEDHTFEGNTCTVCGYVKSSTYAIIAGANGEWTKGGTQGHSVTSDAPFKRFSSVEVDDVTLAESCYTAEEGSTKITLTPAYLEALAIGRHIIDVVSEDGTASTAFTVKNPYTVSFNMNGYGSQIPNQLVPEGGKAIKPVDPKATGFTFGGWYTDPACTAKYDFDSVVTADRTLYAKWTNNSGVPSTGDTGNSLLWLTLLLVSGAALIGTTVYSRKKRYN